MSDIPENHKYASDYEDEELGGATATAFFGSRKGNHSYPDWYWSC